MAVMDTSPSTVASTVGDGSKGQIPEQIDQCIVLNLHLWPALTLAIQNAWGTSSPQISADKRSWLAGAISDLFAQNQLRDLEDLEDVLEQVMSDEFEIVVDDDSLEEVARRIWLGVRKLKAGDDADLIRLQEEYERRKNVKVTGSAGQEQDQETDEEVSDEDWNRLDESRTGNGNEDVDMDEAPGLVEPLKKQEPEVDEDGFTKVVGRKKR